ncbi:MAG: hypothetical protein DMD37_02180 [Gemmatimonadetes bacterium]|nr:MAG: hypothetical protein DMD37_02180 [Gemmatimonadota bacterium]
MIWLRLVHILSGIFWVGATLLMVVFLLPAARAGGAEGRRFLGSVFQRMGPVMGVTALLTIVSGFFLYARVSGGFQQVWVTSPTGRAYGIGALAAILAVIVGAAVNARAGARIGALQKRLAADSATPSAAEAAQLAGWQTRIERGAWVVAGLLLIAAAAMATARYL